MMKPFKELIIEEIEAVKNIPKLFREHRGGLDESLKTTMLCPNGLSSIIEYFKHISYPNPCPYAGIHIRPNPIIDKRLPIWWGEIEYTVMGFINENGHGRIVTLGYCNFK